MIILTVTKSRLYGQRPKVLLNKTSYIKNSLAINVYTIKD